MGGLTVNCPNAECGSQFKIPMTRQQVLADLRKNTHYKFARTTINFCAGLVILGLIASSITAWFVPVFSMSQGILALSVSLICSVVTLAARESLHVFFDISDAAISNARQP